VDQVEKVTDQLDSIIDNDDVVLVQGAGNIGEVVKNLI
jgi:UDP-N-acetylmuramate-alanine ligase